MNNTDSDFYARIVALVIMIVIVAGICVGMYFLLMALLDNAEIRMAFNMKIDELRFYHVVIILFMIYYIVPRCKNEKTKD